MSRPLSILMLSDEKPGHMNQSLGLIEAIERIMPVSLEKLSVKQAKRSLLIGNPGPRYPFSLIVGTGHSTHLPMLGLARKSGSPCVCLMRPSLPTALFDMCLIPEHDLKGKQPPPNVIATLGALNRVPPMEGHEKHSGLILLGGPSPAFDWNGDGVLNALREITKHSQDQPWRMTDSRRTPEGELDRISESIPTIASIPHTETGSEWLPQRLMETREVWVTPDSVSMIYESLSSGARVGLLPGSVIKENRITRGMEKLIKEGWVTPYEEWKLSSELKQAPRVLREADRCAQMVLDRFFRRSPTE